MKRIFLFLITNIAVLLTLGIVANLLWAFLYGPSIVLAPQDIFAIGFEKRSEMNAPSIPYTNA